MPRRAPGAASASRNPRLACRTWAVSSNAKGAGRGVRPPDVSMPAAQRHPLPRRALLPDRQRPSPPARDSLRQLGSNFGPPERSRRPLSGIRKGGALRRRSRHGCRPRRGQGRALPVIPAGWEATHSAQWPLAIARQTMASTPWMPSNSSASAINSMGVLGQGTVPSTLCSHTLNLRPEPLGRRRPRTSALRASALTRLTRRSFSRSSMSVMARPAPVRRRRSWYAREQPACSSERWTRTSGVKIPADIRRRSRRPTPRLFSDADWN